MSTTDHRTQERQKPAAPSRLPAPSKPSSAANSADLALTVPITPTGPAAEPVGGPVPKPWREGTLTRAKEIECLAYGLTRVEGSALNSYLLVAIDRHLAAARQAAEDTKRGYGRRKEVAQLERAISNLDAAHADLLQLAPPSYLLGQIPSLLNEVQRHLPRHDPRRIEFERIALHLGLCPAGATPAPDTALSTQDKLSVVEIERSRIVSIARGANSAGLREQLRVRSFRTVLVISAGVMALLAVLLGLLGWISPATLPLCFQPEQGGQLVLICPTGQSGSVAVDPAAGSSQPQIDASQNSPVNRVDVALVEAIGLIAASIASAAALRRLRGSSEPHGLPVALALLKLPTGALTAVLGLLLMRGEFLPGLSALDSSGQIIAWAIVFGYAQQLFTRFVDEQADSVLNDVRGSRTTGETPGT